MEERLVRVRARTVLLVLLLTAAFVALIEIVSLARSVLVWVLVAVFFAMALNPAVEFVQRRGVRRRGLAVGAVYTGTVLLIAALAASFVPIVVDQVNEFIDAVPDYVQDLTSGRGRLGFLESEYQITDRVREAVEERGASGVLGLSGTALSITKGVLTAVVAVVTIAFLTLFMLLEGPSWTERFYRLLPAGSQERWRAVGRDVYRTVGGYVTGNLTISVIAGVVSTVYLWAVGVPFAVALGLLVAILDLIPLAGATIAAVVVSTIAFFESVPVGIAVAVFFVVYQQLENHVIQPVVYGRTVQLSPLAVLIAVLVGAELAGVIGALGAIPIAGTIQVLLRDWLSHRRVALDPPLPAPAVSGGEQGNIP